MKPDCVIDASCLINCVAAGNIAELIDASGLRWHIPPAIRKETVYTRELDAEGKLIRVRIDVDSMIRFGWLEECELSVDEMNAFVTFAQALDDGEAAALAVAKHRSWLVATDDRKALRACMELGIATVTTATIVCRWADTTGACVGDVARVIRNIERFARISPASDSADSEWWEARRGE